MNKTETNEDTLLTNALAKGNRFFARGNFPLAKREYEAVARIEASKELLEKIKICTAQMAIAQNKEAIKRARKLERKGRYPEALQHFEKAATGEAEDWLVKKIAELRARVARDEIASLADDISGQTDPQARIAAYDKALALEWSPDLVERKADSLVELGQFQEAVQLYEQRSPANDLSRLRFGIACAEMGRYGQALEQWATIENRRGQLLRQMETLLPFVAREGQVTTEAYAKAYAALHRLQDTEKTQRLREYERYFKFRYIEELWRRGDYEQILGILLPLPETLSLPLLDLYAKLYFRLAQQDSRHLETAIPLWLTAVYNDRLLGSLYAYQLWPEGLEPHTIRDRLVQRLEELIARYTREGTLPDSVSALWRMEAGVIQRMSVLALPGSPPQPFPCTPVFAARFSLSEKVFTFLASQAPESQGEKEARLEVGTYFSSSGQALVLLELGEEEKAMSALPKSGRDEFSVYCRQRVFLGYGIKMARQGERQLRRYFTEALPLLMKEPRYVDEIIELAYAGEEAESYTGLAEVMEFLSARIATPKFREATAHVMGIKGVALLDSGVNPGVAEKLLRRAVAICPDAHLAQNTLAEARRIISLDALLKALKKQQLEKAARIVNDNNDPQHIELYFEALGSLYRSVEHWAAPEKSSALWDMYRACRQVEQEHPLTREIGMALKRLEE